MPITLETWPGPMNASTASSGSARIARSGGSTSTWLQNTEKLSMPSSRARRSVIAVAGAVVSNPIARKQT